MRFFVLFALNALVAFSCFKLSTSSPLVNQKRSIYPLAVHTIYQGEIPTWHENLAVRKNGQLLVTRLDTPLLEQIDPSGNIGPIVINQFPADYAGLLGITETIDDIFYVVAAAPFDGDFIKISGNTTIFKVDMTNFAVSSSGVVTKNATITKVTDMPTAGFLNGMTTLNAQAGLILIADAYNGWVYRLNVQTGAYTIIIDDEKMKYLPTSITNLGINGIKIRGSYLYWSNSGNPIFCRICINALGKAVGTSEVVASVNNVDDFAFRADGTAWMAQNQIQSLSMVEDGQTTLVAGNEYSTILAGVTAGAFGRTWATSKILYLTTNGGLAIPVNGSIITGGKVAYIDTSVV